MQKVLTTFLALALSVGLGVGSALANNDLTIKFNKGLGGQTADGNFKFKFGGRIMADSAWYDADEPLEAFLGDMFDDGSEFRRARLYFSGTVYEDIIFKAQYDFAGSDVDIKDLYVGLKDLPILGTLKVGHFKEPFSLEELTSSKYITFMERSMLNEAFTPGRNHGIAFQNTAADGRVNYAFGIFREADSSGDSVCDDENYTGRVAGTPWEGENGDVFHIGIGGSYRMACDDEWRIRIRPESHLAPRLIDTDVFMTEEVNLYNVELAFVRGPFSIQGEHFEADFDMGGGSDPSGDGYYVEASWFVTGESRPYKSKSAAFGRVSPENNFSRANGTWGAVQLALRMSEVDLMEIDGSEAEAWMAGVNWYLNPNTRVMLNYGLAERSDLAGDNEVDFFQTRFQIDF